MLGLYEYLLEFHRAHSNLSQAAPHEHDKRAGWVSPRRKTNPSRRDVCNGRAARKGGGVKFRKGLETRDSHRPDEYRHPRDMTLVCPLESGASIRSDQRWT